MAIFEKEELLKTPYHIEVGLAIDEGVKNHSFVDGQKIIDWHNNDDILGAINIEIGDKIYELHQKYDLDTDWSKIDAIIEECIKVAKIKYS